MIAQTGSKQLTVKRRAIPTITTLGGDNFADNFANQHVRPDGGKNKTSNYGKFERAGIRSIGDDMRRDKKGKTKCGAVWMHEKLVM
jgi:hypothetical protein